MKKLPEALPRWARRAATAAALLAAYGYFSTPAVSPLMCKIYG